MRWSEGLVLRAPKCFFVCLILIFQSDFIWLHFDSSYDSFMTPLWFFLWLHYDSWSFDSENFNKCMSSEQMNDSTSQWWSNRKAFKWTAWTCNRYPDAMAQALVSALECCCSWEPSCSSGTDEAAELSCRFLLSACTPLCETRGNKTELAALPWVWPSLNIITPLVLFYLAGKHLQQISLFNTALTLGALSGAWCIFLHFQVSFLSIWYNKYFILIVISF